LAGAAIDAGGVQVGNYNDPYYQKLINHPKILATPHIAYNTDITARVANDMMIDNIEAWIKGTPKNLI
jgi:phosphoglycerate dehydrogenase-like enzyme